MEKILSIIIPSYNTPEDVLERCLKSIAYGKDVEHRKIETIVVDDGSEGLQASFIDSIKDRYSLTVVHKKNGGEASARNAGLNIASGKYVMFIDSDDAVPEGWISTSLGLAEKFNADIVSGVVKMCNSIPSEKVNYKFSARTLYGSEIDLVQRDQLYHRTSLVKNIPYIDYGVCSKLYLRSLIGTCRFKEGVVLSVDQIFNHAMLKRCSTYVLTNIPSYYYIMNTQSVSHTYRSNAVDVMMGSLQEVKKELRDNPEIKNAFYFHVAQDLVRAIDMECFANPKKNLFQAKINKIKKAMNNPLAIEAMEHFNSKDYATFRHKVYGFELKHKMPYAYWATRTVVILTYNKMKVKPETSRV